ncbi:hypothetical protein LXL04_036052 [Taraxacum kok-saghyz]
MHRGTLVLLVNRRLGTAREEESLNIFLEFVPGGSISSLLGKFGSFPKSEGSKLQKVVELATMTSANQWSVGCTVIEMATGKPPWSQQYQEMFCLGCCSFSYRNRTTKAHPPIPYHLSMPTKVQTLF